MRKQNNLGFLEFDVLYSSKCSKLPCFYMNKIVFLVTISHSKLINIVFFFLAGFSLIANNMAVWIRVSF